MSIETIIKEALAGNPVEMKEAFEEEIQKRVEAAIAEAYKKAAMKEEDDEDEDDDDDDEDEDDDDEDEDEK